MRIHRLFHRATLAQRACALMLLVLCALPASAQNTPGTALQPEAVSQDVQLLFSLAALFNPAVFGGMTTGWYEHDGYIYQYFINSRTYAGVRNGQVFVLGGAYGNSITPAGSLDNVLALLMDKTGANVISVTPSALNFEYTNGAINLPQPQTLALSASLPTGWTLFPGTSWMSVSQSSGTTGDGTVVTVSINNNAANLATGKHTGLLLVRNDNDQHLSVNLPVVFWVADPGVAVTNSTANVLDFDVTSVASDAKHGNLYFSDEFSKRVYQVDAASGLTQRYFQFAKTPDRMTVSPDGTRLYVGLLDQPHSAYWWDEEQTGAIGIINLETEVLLGQFAVDLDPYELAATDSGKLLVSGGSGQWTSIESYDVITGAKTGAAAQIYQGARLSLHPNQQLLYSSDTGLSPGDIRKYDISGEGVVLLGDSPYHGDHATYGGVWVSPSGRHLYTAGGDVFLATSLLYVTTLSTEYLTDLAFDAATNSAVVLTNSDKLQRYGLADYRFLETVGTGLVDPLFVNVIGGDVVVVDFVTGEYVLKRF